MKKDIRHYFIRKTEIEVLEALATKVLKELEEKKEVSILEKDLKEQIFERIYKEIKEEIKKEENKKILIKQIQDRFGFGYSMDGVVPEEEFDRRRHIAEEEFDELHLYGRVRSFFKNTGIGTKPGRNKDGKRSYIFNDAVKTPITKYQDEYII